MKNWSIKKSLFLGLIVLSLFGIAIFIYSKRSKGEYVKVVRKTIKEYIYASCLLNPKNFVVVKAEVSGKISKIYVKEGEKVKPGQVLAEIEPVELPDRIAELKIRLRLIEERLQSNSSYLETLRKNYEKAKTDLENAERKYLRRKELYSLGLIAREELEESERVYLLAKQSLEQTRHQLNDAELGLKREKEALQKQLRALEADLRRYLVRSPIGGRIYNKYVEVGDFVSPTSGKGELFALGSDDHEVLLEVDEEFSAKISPNQVVFFSFDALPDRIIRGTIVQVVPQIDKNRRTFIAKANIDENMALPAQATCEANILINQRTALVVPKKALRDEEVHTKSRGKVRVKVGRSYDDFVEVLEGLSEGEEVLVYK